MLLPQHFVQILARSVASLKREDRPVPGRRISEAEHRDAVGRSERRQRPPHNLDALLVRVLHRGFFDRVERSPPEGVLPLILVAGCVVDA